MTSVVSKLVVKTLCANGGSLDFRDLDIAIKKHFTVADSILRSILCDDGKIAIKEGTIRKSDFFISPDSIVLAKTSLRLCRSPPGECISCDELHICRYYVCGNCRFGNKCKNPHSFSSNNSGLLMRFGLQDLSDEELRYLLLQNDPYLLPEICPHYNRGDGPHGACKFTARCTNIHLCLHFVQGDCKFGEACKRAHTLNDQAMKILSGRGLSPENLRQLFKIYRNRFIISDNRPVNISAPPVVRESSAPIPSPQSSGTSNPIGEADRNEICLYFIRRHCSFKDKCARVHFHLPYKWQVLGSDGKTWKDLLNMEDIEKAYCDPAQDTSCTGKTAQVSRLFGFLSLQPSPPADDKSVNFLTMTCEGAPVRRLSTASSVSKPPHFILTTEWQWYWKDEVGQWHEYGDEGSDNKMAAITSKTLENVYLADTESEIPFSTDKNNYILHFKEMYQQNNQYKTKREVRRRPRFVSSQEVEAKLKGGSSLPEGSPATAVPLPSHWDQTSPPASGSSYQLITLAGSAKEYKMVAKLFHNTMPSRGIQSIRRIQNPSLWRVFDWQKQQMKERNGGKSVDERYLFHGTDQGLIEPICEQNFDWRICGVHGTLYGRGSYFARDASYSDRYSSSKGAKKKIMFVCLILVGDFTTGKSSYLRPPARADGKSFYDSCVNSMSDPSIFVVFEKYQIYILSTSFAIHEK